MKKILIPLLLLCVTTSHAQLNNSWIDYTKAYFKFQVGKSGVYRINQAALVSAGVNTTAAEQFQLWRNGVEVRLFTSIPTGPLSVSDYIEFWGVQNDGKADKNLYLDTLGQLSDSFSLETDTATYFLTLNSTTSNLRFLNTANNTAKNTLAPDAYFMRKVGTSYNAQYNPGRQQYAGEPVYSSAYDYGEGYTSGDIGPGGDFLQTYNNLNVYTSGPSNSVSLYVTACGNSLYQRNLQVALNNNVLYNDVPLNSFTVVKKQVDNIPLNYLSNTNGVPIRINGYVAPPYTINAYDRIVVGEILLTYPATFNFNNSSNFYFELQASAVGNYLEITNFNAGASPVLYSINDGQRYVGDISESGKVKFLLPASTASNRKFMLVNEDATNITTVNALSSKSFVNYTASINQGDYLIISNTSLYNDGNGNNYVDQYRQYRASAAGGSYNSKVVSIDELNDQFAFGIKKHPAAIRDFIIYATQYFTVKPKYIFIIGRGLSSRDYKPYNTNVIVDQLDLVQSFGWPASDILLTCLPGTNSPLLPIGRLAVINGTEIKYYLDKIKQYEQNQSSTSQTITDKGWMKTAINVSGGSKDYETTLFDSYLNGYQNSIQDSSFGGYVETFDKLSSTPVEQASGLRIEQLINGGCSLIQYFGHSSANTLAFNLDDPTSYSNQGKYPVFNASGCDAGNFYSFDPTRLTGGLTLSEKYVLADQRGSIAFIASTHLGIAQILDDYNSLLYKNIALNQYGNTIGNQLKSTIQTLATNFSSAFFYRCNMEEVNLQGDPALKINSFALPDFVIEDKLVKISPSIISLANTNFTVNVKWMNIGRTINDSIRVLVTRILPNNLSQVLYNKIILATVYADSLTFVVPINTTTDKGLNKIIVTLDADNRVAELSKTNNTLTKQFYIIEDDIIPVSPYNYSIINKQNITFTASTANALGGQRQYIMEFDTTQLFNSVFKKQYTANGIGGIVEFKPTNITFADSTVYYWRTSIVPINGAQQIWNSFSFVYLPNSTSGFNQSHYFQHLESTFGNNIELDSDRVFRFQTVYKDIIIRTGLYPATGFDKISVSVGFAGVERYGCRYGSLQFLVYDTSTLAPWVNFNSKNPVTNENTGRYSSYPVCSAPRKFFEFPYYDPVYRQRAIDFIDSIPNGMYVSITNLGWTYTNSFVSEWKSDQAKYGKNLYDKLKSIGFSKIDSFTKNVPFIYFYKKNSPSYTPVQIMGNTASDQPVGEYLLPSKLLSGTIESPAFGPAKNWKSLHWNGKSIDPTLTDSVTIQVFGLASSNSPEVLLASVNPATDTSLAFVNAAVYPFIKLKMLNADTTYATPNQLNYWRVNGDYVPEGAVAPNILFTMKDSVDQGAIINFSLAFKNVSSTAFVDSLKLKLVITDNNNAAHIIPLPKGKALVPGDTLSIKYNIDTKNYSGNNTLYVMVNPDNDQQEQYLFNNLILKNFYVKQDKFNPLLDVTFDGVHILNRDIVAAKPHILIKLKDESHFLALRDTSLLKMQVRYPDGTLHNYFFGDSVRFTPANLATGQNTATIDFMPHFPQDGDYQFIVSGKDVVGNKAGALQYQVTFSIINKPMISNMLNYPNPFTTSTAFVFTVTGSDVPQNIRIQILTITGKVVRDITKAELGPIHIGRNITDFKWDGTDGYGQKVANGVYLYRVITNLNGKRLDKYTSKDDTTDQYFTKGYGKMYLMR